jgi:2-oxoglutarate ferredoxin oxidoreductase subunit alpha
MRIGIGTYFMQGNEACVEAAIFAGASFFAGYPITPSTEIAEGLARRLPEEGGMFLQMEDELASIAAVIGASWTGAKALTATSGPGFSLMQENIGYAAMTETPLVIVDVMRGGPSTGMPTRASQGDVMQARHGSHGDYGIIALAPSNVQEMFDLTVQAFNFTERYRVPVILLSDAEVGHMRGKLSVRHIDVHNRKVRGPPVLHDGFAYDDSLIPPFPMFGKGNRVHVTGLTHDHSGYPSNDPSVQEELVTRLEEKLLRNREDICLYEVVNPDAERFIIAYGSPSLSALQVAREDPAIGVLRLQTLWPLAEEAIAEVAQKAEDLVMLEMNRGQLFPEVQRLALLNGCRKARLLSKVNGHVHSPREILSFLNGGERRGVLRPVSKG